MGIIALNLGVSFLITSLILFIGIPLFSSMPTLAIGSLVSLVGLTLGVVVLVMPKLNKRLAVTGLVTCQLGIVVSALLGIG